MATAFYRSTANKKDILISSIISQMYNILQHANNWLAKLNVFIELSTVDIRLRILKKSGILLKTAKKPLLTWSQAQDHHH